jgi:hypothetical protein
LAEAKELANTSVPDVPVHTTGADAAGLGGVGVGITDNSSDPILKNLQNAGGGPTQTLPEVYSIDKSKYDTSGFNDIVGGDYDNDVQFTIKYTDDKGYQKSFTSH